jgi:hypothetical protein
MGINPTPDGGTRLALCSAIVSASHPCWAMEQQCPSIVHLVLI